jgi:hypothetical protein
MIPRKKIIAYIANVKGIPLDPSRSIELSRTIRHAYSGFVHGASPHIMDLYGGNPPHFHTTGMLGTPRMEEYADDLLNYVYRTFLSHKFVAEVFGADKIIELLDQHKLQFEKEYGQKLF